MTMNKFPLSPLAALGLLLASTAGAASDGKGSSNVPTAASFNAMQRYAISYDDTRDVAQFYLRDAGFKLHDAEFAEFDDPGRQSDKIVLTTIDGLKDDAVQGLQWRFRMRFSEGQWTAVEAGVRRKCYRGSNAGEWTKDICP